MTYLKRIIVLVVAMFTLCGCSLVYKPLYDIQLTYDRLDLKPSAFYTIPVSGNDISKIKWSSSNPNIVKIVNKSGKINAITNGQAIVSAKIGHSYWDITVNVKNQKDYVIGYKDSSPTICNPEAPDTKSLDAYKIEISKKSYNYTGKAIKPKVRVINGSQNMLVKNVDYKVKYSNNIDVGTAKIVVKGINKYTGKIKLTFKIVDSIDKVSKNSKTLAINDQSNVQKDDNDTNKSVLNTTDSTETELAENKSTTSKKSSTSSKSSNNKKSSSSNSSKEKSNSTSSTSNKKNTSSSSNSSKKNSSSSSKSDVNNNSESAKSASNSKGATDDESSSNNSKNSESSNKNQESSDNTVQEEGTEGTAHAGDIENSD